MLTIHMGVQMKKRLLVLVAILAIAPYMVLLTACGGGTDGKIKKFDNWFANFGESTQWKFELSSDYGTNTIIRDGEKIRATTGTKEIFHERVRENPDLAIDMEIPATYAAKYWTYEFDEDLDEWQIYEDKSTYTHELFLYGPFGETLPDLLSSKNYKKSGKDTYSLKKNKNPNLFWLHTSTIVEVAGIKVEFKSNNTKCVITVDYTQFDYEDKMTITFTTGTTAGVITLPAL